MKTLRSEKDNAWRHGLMWIWRDGTIWKYVVPSKAIEMISDYRKRGWVCVAREDYVQVETPKFTKEMKKRMKIKAEKRKEWDLKSGNNHS